MLAGWLGSRDEDFRAADRHGVARSVPRLRHRTGRATTASGPGAGRLPCRETGPDLRRRGSPPHPAGHLRTPRPRAGPAVPDPPAAAPPRGPAHRQATRELLAALLAGDPNDEVTAAWIVAQDLMAAYANPDRAAGKAAAEKLITTARSCPVPEIARLGSTLTAWRTEFLARFDHPDRIERPHRITEPESQEHQTRRTRLPVLRQLQAATTSQPRNHQR